MGKIRMHHKAHWEIGDRVELAETGSTPKTGTVMGQAQWGKRGKNNNAVTILWDGDTDPPILGYSCVRNCHLLDASADAQ